MENMETKRIAMIAIVVENRESTAAMNEILHEYADYIIGRMGIPYKERHISLISIAMDAPMNIINALTGRIGNLDGITVRAAYSKTA